MLVTKMSILASVSGVSENGIRGEIWQRANSSILSAIVSDLS
jgi:hypothetical protein